MSFLRVFNAATEAVKQGGTRRGANMGVLRVDHPDVLEFIECKLDGGITNFNISVARHRCLHGGPRRRRGIRPDQSRAPARSRAGCRARDVFDRIVRAAWRTGDPGMIFLDRINREPRESRRPTSG